MKLNLRGHVADKSVDLGMDAAHTGGMGGGEKKSSSKWKGGSRDGAGVQEVWGLVVKTTASLSYTPLFVLCAEGSVFFNVLAVSGTLIVWDTMVLYESQACAWVSFKIKGHVSFVLIIRHNFISGHGHLFDSFPSKAWLACLRWLKAILCLITRHEFRPSSHSFFAIICVLFTLLCSSFPLSLLNVPEVSSS